MTAIPFDDSGRCHGSQSPITFNLRPLCITCSRLTSKRNPAPIKGQCFQHQGGSWDCKLWKGHAATVRLDAGQGKPLDQQSVDAASEHTAGVSS